MNISFVLPCYRRAKWLAMALRANACYFLPDAEVILVLDEPSEEREILRIAKNTPGAQFRVIVNDWDHPWRPPSIAINVGVRAATAPHVAVLSPETVIQLPRPTYLRELLAKDWRASYGGVLWHLLDADSSDDSDAIQNKALATRNMRSPSSIGYGFVMFQKQLFEKMHGLDESRTEYGGDDNELRQRMVLTGTRFVVDPHIHIFHPFHDGTPRKVKAEQETPVSVILPQQRETWGRAFSRVAYDWNSV